MPPKLRVFTANPRFEQRAKMDISTSLAAVLKTHPKLGPKEAMWIVRDQMLANNPYEPPSNGKCPINDLPAEILGHIFEIGVMMQEDGEDEDEDDWEDMSIDDEDKNDLTEGSPLSIESCLSSIDSTSDEDPPFQILASHVCRHWREVALNLHVLWTTLAFDGCLKLEKSKVFIDRAKGLPLNIYMDCESLEDDTDEEDPPQGVLSQDDLKQILDLIEPEVSHWGEIEFHFDNYDYVQILLSRLHQLPSAPLLKKFHVFQHGDEESHESNYDDMINYLPFHGNAPLLESAVFWGIHIDWDNSPCFLRGLRHLELSYHDNDVRPSYTTFIQLIKNSPDLRFLELSLSGPALASGAQFDDEDQWGPEPFDIPSVHYLTLQFHEPQAASALIQHFYFPNLCGLKLNFDAEDYTSFVYKLLVPVKGRPKSILSGLESLEISGLPCNVASAEAMLKQLTKLKTLCLKCYGPEELMIFQKLIHPSHGREETKAVTETLPDIFCPLLETLTVTLVDESLVKRLVTARKTAGVPLKKLRLSNETVSKETHDWLENQVEVVEYFEPSDSEEEGSEDEDEDEDEVSFSYEWHC